MSGILATLSDPLDSGDESDLCERIAKQINRPPLNTPPPTCPPETTSPSLSYRDPESRSIPPTKVVNHHTPSPEGRGETETETRKAVGPTSTGTESSGTRPPVPSSTLAASHTSGVKSDRKIPITLSRRYRSPESCVRNPDQSPSKRRKANTPGVDTAASADPDVVLVSSSQKTPVANQRRKVGVQFGHSIPELSRKRKRKTADGYRHAYTNDIITLRVGRQKVDFFIHVNKLRAQSEHFADCIPEIWEAELVDRPVYIDKDILPDVAEVFVEYAYTGQFENTRLYQKYIQSGDWQEQLPIALDLCIFTYEFECPKMREEVIKLLDQPLQFRAGNADIFEKLRDTWKVARDNDPLRQRLADHVATNWRYFQKCFKEAGGRLVHEEEEAAAPGFMTAILMSEAICRPGVY